MTASEAILHLENMKWLLGVNNTTVDDIPLPKVIDDIIGLLKVQEPVEPNKVNRYIDFDGEGQPFTPETYDCGNCGKELPQKAKYCPECGRGVKQQSAT